MAQQTSFRSWPIVLMAFGCLLTIVTVSGFQTTQRARRIYDEVLRVRQLHGELERTLGRVQSDLFESSVSVRDYLLDRSPLAEPAHRERLVALRTTVRAQLDRLEKESPKESRERVRALREEVDAYFSSIAPLFQWTPVQRLALSSFFLQQQVLPRRKSVVAITKEIAELNEANLRLREAEIEWRQREYRRDLRTIFIATGAFSLLIALASVIYVTRLERRAEASFQKIEQDEAEMRHLSQQIVHAQEKERTSLSRELHDEVGQLLTGLKIEIGNVERARTKTGPAFERSVSSARQLAEQALQSVRGIAMGLRPSMLDDLGLEAALNWQTREFSRRCGVPATLEVDGSLDSIPDEHRTAIYRIVQEALTNISRHASARSVRIMLHGDGETLTLTVQDDGIGFAPSERRSMGLGLVGMEERARKLGGRVTVRSQPRKGSVVLVELPLEPKEEMA